MGWKDSATPVTSPSSGSWKTADTTAPVTAAAQPDPTAAAASPLDQIGSALSTAGNYVNDKAAAGLIGAEDGLELGYRPQIHGAIGGVVDTAKQAMGYGDNKSFADNYLTNRDKALAEQNYSNTNSPTFYNTGELAGGMAVPLPGAAETRMEKVALGLVHGIGYGEAMNPGDTPGQFSGAQMSGRESNAKMGALVGGGLSTIAATAPAVWKKGISTFLGPNDSAIDKYLDHPDRINEAPNLETLKDMVDGQISNMTGNVDTTDTAVRDAQADLRNTQGQLSNAQNAAATDYRNGTVDAKGASQLAAGNLADQTAALEAQQSQVPHPREMAPDVQASVADLKKQVIDGSAQARQILEDSNATIQTKPLLDNLRAKRAAMFPETGPITPQAQATDAALEQLEQNLGKLPETVSGASAKKLVQQLDEAADWNRSQGGFSGDLDNTYKQLRSGVDTQLKGNTAYAEKMADVSKKTQLLNHANDLFGTPESTYSTLNNITSPGKVPQRSALTELGDATGKDFTSPVEKYTQAQDAIKGGLSPLGAGQAADKASMLDDILSNPAYRDNRVGQAVEQTGLPAQVNSKQAQLAQLQEQLAQAKESVAPYSSWTPKTTQTKLNGLMSKAPDKASIEDSRQLSALNEMMPDDSPDYNQVVDDNKVRNQFTRQYTNGSRNTNIWKAVGGGLGGAAGFIVPGSHAATVPSMAAAGALMGGYIDKNGGQMAKGLLDTYLNNKTAIDATRNAIPRALLPYLESRKDNR